MATGSGGSSAARATRAAHRRVGSRALPEFVASYHEGDRRGREDPAREGLRAVGAALIDESIRGLKGQLN
jgi:hypothetical protein